MWWPAPRFTAAARLALLALLALPPAWAAPRSTWSTDPDKQPATRGQDGQRCAFGYLPGRVQIIGNPPGLMGAVYEGSLTTQDKAILMDWSVDLFSWAQPAVRMFLDSKLLYKSEVVKEPADLGGAWLDLWEEPRLRRVVALKDCDDVIVYVLRVRRGDRDPEDWTGEISRKRRIECDYEIYNQDGELVALSSCDENSDFPDQVHFLDPQGNVFTAAQTPIIDGGYVPFRVAEFNYGVGVPSHEATEKERDRHAPGYLRHWDVWFVDGEPGEPSNSSLLLAQNRWVVLAALLDRALRDAWEEGDWASRPASSVWMVGLALRASAAILLTVLLLSAFGTVHTMTFPPIHHSALAHHASVLAKPRKGGGGAVGGPSTGAYGSFAPAPAQAPAATGASLAGAMGPAPTLPPATLPPAQAPVGTGVGPAATLPPAMLPPRPVA